jgi:hypothetical protein
MRSTMRSIISALFIGVSSLAWAQAAKPLELAPDAPDRHIVVPGDTLWDIAKMFLKDPFRWPEIWRLNTEEVRNPHWIYPGQVIVLDRSGDQPRLVLGTALPATAVKLEPRIYVEQERRAIPTIPQHIIEPFLSRPLVVDGNALDNAARIVALPEGRAIVASGDAIYATGVRGTGTHWQIFRSGEPLRDPDRPEEVLGLETIYLGAARVVREGEPATLAITASREEIWRNDFLMQAPEPAMMNYVPHAPAQPVRGRVLALYGGVGAAGKLSIVSISRGARDGLEIGHVLALYSAGAEVVNRFDGKVERYRLPDERYGALLVFRVFDRVAYALVMEAERPVVAGDAFGTP